MANKQINHSYKGMIQDITKSRFSNQFYFEGKNIRIVATDTQSEGSIVNEKGNEFILSIPTPVIDYLNKEILYDSKVLPFESDEILNLPDNSTLIQKIIGTCTTRDSIILITTDNNGIDCVWSVSYENYDITLLYLRNLELINTNPIQILNNFENEKIDKIYWVDSTHQVRSLNIKHSILNGDLEELINVPESSINMIGDFNFSTPIITKITEGGNHTAGKIQYAYNLYRLNSSQTKLSPFSELISLDKGNLGGGALNEVVSKSPVVSITNIDVNYTNIKVYSIKYNSYNEIPIISLIEDREIPFNRTLDVYDNNTIINTLSLEEFLFLGSDIIIPKHINSKDNRLFLANYKEKNFEINLDTRAYSFDDNQISIVYNDIFYDDVNDEVTASIPNTRTITSSFTDNYDDKFDSINLNYNTYKFQYTNNNVFGGEGKYLKYELTKDVNFDDRNQYFKDEEIYRLGIEFYNKYGQKSLPKWIADFKSLNGNLEGQYNTLSVTLKNDFYVWLNNSSNFETEYDKPVGYRILIAERTINDRTIVSNGILGTMMFNVKSTQANQDNIFVLINSEKTPKIPNLLLRNCNDNSAYGITAPLQRCSHLGEMSLNGGPLTEGYRAHFQNTDTSGRLYQFNSMLQMYSPETLFNFNTPLTSSLKLKIKGLLKNKYNSNWAKEIDLNNATVQREVKTINCLSSYFGLSLPIADNPFEITNTGIIGHPGDSNPNRTEKNLYYRGYGDVLNSDNNDQINIVDFIPDITITSGDNSLNNLSKVSTKAIKLKLDSSYNTLNISYTITPDTPYLSDTYSIKISSDPNGSNVVSLLNNVTGVQTLNIIETFTPTLSNLFKNHEYYLIIENSLLFNGSVDSIFEVTNGVDFIKGQILNQNFNFQSVSTVSSNFYIPINENNLFDIYGTPVLTEKGQGFTTYNNDVNYRFSNSLESVLTDGNSSWNDDGLCGRRITSVNSDNNRCITFVTGADDPSVKNWERINLEGIYYGLNQNKDNMGIIGELIKNDYEIYLGGIYGGNSWEDKNRTNYIQIGNYKDIQDDFIYIESPGDTFVNFFKFLRIVKKDLDINNQCVKEYEEIVEFYTETTIDLKNRNDLSINDWDSKFSYKNEEYHKYNNVYSQQSNFIKNRNINYNIKKNSNFDINIIASKLKSPGELIDNWTDLLPNEVLSLDGKYGPINSLTSFNDELYTIQDRAFAFLSINPRIQVQASDGLAVELGNGNLLQDYKYISTDSGTLNRWSVISTPKGIYYFDLINKSFNRFEGNISGISDKKDMHIYFNNNIEFDILKKDNPLIYEGISVGYDYINNDVLMSFHQNNKFTISFNENIDHFQSFYDFVPSLYINRGFHFLTTYYDNNQIYKHFEGDYNRFYDFYYPSSITLNVNPEADKDCVFDNINFKSDVTLNNIDQVDQTITHIQAYNDYQDSTLIPLVVGRNNNLRRKFRDWNALIPRENRNRIRAPYIKLKLQFDNQSNYKMILHDVSVFYTTS
jgi:hypothetical protein